MHKTNIEVIHNHDVTNYKGKFLLLGKFLLISVFAISFRQWPLYSSNQNTYFVHGLANAGVGHLNLDWFAQTTDPFPVFSALVNITVRFIDENAFYFYQIIIQGIYAYSILGIASYVFNFGNMSIRYLSYFSLLVTLYSGLLTQLLSKLPVLSYFAPIVDPDKLLRGVAYQYIFGQYFQPSVFGVFIVLSIYVFLYNYSLVAIMCLVIAVTFHFGYLLSAIILTLTYILVIVNKDKNYRKAIFLVMTAFACIVPITIYNYFKFGPTTAEIFAQAQNILVHYRIPHHAMVTNWFGISTLAQIMVVVLSLYLVRGTRVFPVLFFPFLVTIILTVFQYLTENKTLALLFPWRTSVFLVPISSSIVFASIISIVFQIFKQLLCNNLFVQNAVQLALIIGCIIIFILSLAADYIGIGDRSDFGLMQSLGIVIGFSLLITSLSVPYWHRIFCILGQARIILIFQVVILGIIILYGYWGVCKTIKLMNTPRVGLTASVRFITSTYQPGNLYLIPPDLEWFRLAARVPILVDFKSHPYKDIELIEWFNRVKIAKEFYASSGEAACEILQNIVNKYGITHVVSKSSIANCNILQELYRDGDFVIHKLQNCQ